MIGKASEVTFAQELREAVMWICGGRNIPGRGRGRCKGSEVRVYVARWKKQGGPGDRGE